MKTSSIHILLAVGVLVASCANTTEHKEETKDGHVVVIAQIDSIAKTISAKVGVAVLHIESGDTFSYNGYAEMPMQSTYKFPLALAIMGEVDKGKKDLHGKCLLREGLMADDETHSPLRDKYGPKGVHTSLHEILYYTVAESDNIGCDALFSYIGGPQSVDSIIHSKGFNNIRIVSTEVELHEDVDKQYRNWVYPIEMTRILAAFYKQQLLSKTSTDTLLNIMKRTTGGTNRIKGLLPPGTVVAHKTGTCAPQSGINTINDVGIITMPDGSHLALSIYVSNTRESIENSEMVMAQIAKAIYDDVIRE